MYVTVDTLLCSGHVTVNARFVLFTSATCSTTEMSSPLVSPSPSTPSSSSPVRVAPLISERYLDIPSQRLYALSFALLIQVRTALVDPRVDEPAISRP
jgi:hypothetical protein